MGLFGKIFGTVKPAPPCEIHPDDRDLVRPEDVEWWNSLSLDDCLLMEKNDNVYRLAAFQKFREQDGLSVDDAGKKVRLQFPTFYWSLKSRAEEKFKLNAADAMLPYVIKNRINCAIVSGQIDKHSVQTAPSFNALMRQMIRAGRF